MSASFAFAPKGVELAKNFLNDKFERPTDRLFFAQMMGELREVTFELASVLPKCRSGRRKGKFPGQPLVILADQANRSFQFVQSAPPGIFNNGGMKLREFL